MVKLTELNHYLSDLLNVPAVQDYCPNGLQVEGRENIHTFITGVTACQALLDGAIAKKADAILVHHGYFWKGESPCLVGMKKNRVQTLLNENVNLFAYHLPLDIHPLYGNNVMLAEQLGITLKGEFDTETNPNLGFYGELDNPMSADDFSKVINEKLNRKPFLIAGGHKQIKTIGLCTGGAQDFIFHAANAGLDAYITGEISERTVHIAREMEIHFFAAGHHATERYGVQALGKHLAEKFNLSHEFIDIDNPA